MKSIIRVARPPSPQDDLPVPITKCPNLLFPPMQLTRNTNRWRRAIALGSLAAFLAAGLPGELPHGAMLHVAEASGDAGALGKACGHSHAGIRHGCRHSAEPTSLHDCHEHAPLVVGHPGALDSRSDCCFGSSPCRAGLRGLKHLADACHGPNCPACPNCPCGSGCCHCTIAKLPCVSSAVPLADLAPCLGQRMADAAALYSPPFHARTTPPPKV